MTKTEKETLEEIDYNINQIKLSLEFVCEGLKNISGSISGGFDKIDRTLTGISNRVYSVSLALERHFGQREDEEDNQQNH